MATPALTRGPASPRAFGNTPGEDHRLRVTERRVLVTEPMGWAGAVVPSPRTPGLDASALCPPELSSLLRSFCRPLGERFRWPRFFSLSLTLSRFGSFFSFNGFPGTAGCPSHVAELDHRGRLGSGRCGGLPGPGKLSPPTERLPRVRPSAARWCRVRPPHWSFQSQSSEGSPGGAHAGVSFPSPCAACCGLCRLHTLSG